MIKKKERGSTSIDPLSLPASPEVSVDGVQELFPAVLESQGEGWVAPWTRYQFVAGLTPKALTAVVNL